MVNHPNRSKDSKRSAALATFIEEFDLRRVSTIADGEVTIRGYIGARGCKVLTVDLGDDGWDVFVPVSSENKVSATKEAFTAYLAADPKKTLDELAAAAADYAKLIHVENFPKEDAACARAYERLRIAINNALGVPALN